jgi:hypothetical protein
MRMRFAGAYRNLQTIRPSSVQWLRFLISRHYQASKCCICREQLSVNMAFFISAAYKNSGWPFDVVVFEIKFSKATTHTCCEKRDLDCIDCYLVAYRLVSRHLKFRFCRFIGYAVWFELVTSACSRRGDGYDGGSGFIGMLLRI